MGEVSAPREARGRSRSRREARGPADGSGEGIIGAFALLTERRAAGLPGAARAPAAPEPIGNGGGFRAELLLLKRRIMV